MNQIGADVIVVGGGPAGCTLALRLARVGCRVALLERTEYGEFRIGESLPPAAVPRLAELGVWEAFLQTHPVAVHGVQSVWGIAELNASSFLSSPFLNGWHVDRSRFDAMLSAAAENAGARIFRQTIARSIEQGPPSSWSVTATSPQGECRFLSRFLVDATGRSAHVCTKLGVECRRVDRLVGVSRLWSETLSRGFLPSLVEAHPLGWWYSGGLPAGRAIAIFFTDSDLCARYRLTHHDAWHRVLDESPHTRARLSTGVPSPSLHVFPAATHCLHCAAADSWLAIGDALTSRDPLSSSGVDFALASAERASSVLCELANGDHESVDAYNAEVHLDFAVYLDQRRAFYAMERRWPDSPFWLRRHRAPIDRQDQRHDPDHQEYSVASDAPPLPS